MAEPSRIKNMSWNLSRFHSPVMLIALFGFTMAIIIEAETVIRKIAIVKATTNIESSALDKLPKMLSSSDGNDYHYLLGVIGTV